MNIIISLFYRAFQKTIYLVSFLLPWREPKLIENEKALTKLAKELISKKRKRVCVVTDSGIKEVGLLQLLLNALAEVEIDYFVYDKTIANPSIQNAQEAAVMYIVNDCSAFIAIGGGSPIDCAKVAAALVAKKGKQVQEFTGLLRVLKKIPMLYAIPTTAGTGSETTLAAVVSDTDTHEKYVVKDPSIIPHGAVLAPELTIGLPPHLTAQTGLDALAHAIEAFIGRSGTSTTEKHALEAIKLIFTNLPLAFKNGSNLEARANMQKAAYLAGLAFTRAYVGYVHAIGHSLGSLYGIPHGLAIAVTTPYVIAAYGEEGNEKLAEIAEYLNLCTNIKSETEKAQCFISAVIKLQENLKIQKTFDQIKKEDIPTLAKMACKEGNPEYPVPRIIFKPEMELIIDKIRTGNNA